MPLQDSIARLRAICMALAEVEERLSHGEPAWFVRGKKQFVSFVNRHHDDRVGFWCAAPPGAQEVLVGADPLRFFRPPGACPEPVEGWAIAAGSAFISTSKPSTGRTSQTLSATLTESGRRSGWRIACKRRMGAGTCGWGPEHADGGRNMRSGRRATLARSLGGL